jgi:5-methylcytosine-specific restriction endonuclease McrA
LITKLCLCGNDAIVGQTRCADCTRPRDRSNDKPPKHKHLHTARWTNLSKRLRKASPFCEICQATTDLVVDHVIPLSERPDLAFEVANCRVLCRPHNASRRATCTDEERAAVLARIAARKRRRTAI